MERNEVNSRKRCLVVVMVVVMVVVEVEVELLKAERRLRL
jgi:hypothetical protein